MVWELHVSRTDLCPIFGRGLLCYSYRYVHGVLYGFYQTVVGVERELRAPYMFSDRPLSVFHADAIYVGFNDGQCQRSVRGISCVFTAKPLPASDPHRAKPFFCFPWVPFLGDAQALPSLREKVLQLRLAATLLFSSTAVNFVGIFFVFKKKEENTACLRRILYVEYTVVSYGTRAVVQYSIILIVIILF